jgi:hypothetical protein
LFSEFKQETTLLSPRQALISAPNAAASVKYLNFTEKPLFRVVL